MLGTKDAIRLGNEINAIRTRLTLEFVSKYTNLILITATSANGIKKKFTIAETKSHVYDWFGRRFR